MLDSASQINFAPRPPRTFLLAEKAAVQRLAYNHDGAKSTLRRLLALDPDAAWAWLQLGDIARITGASDEALRCFRTAADAAGRVGGDRDLSVSMNKIGDVLVRQGNLPEALKSYQAGLSIRERLSRTDAGNSDWQRDLIVSCVKIAEVFPAEASAMLTRAGAIANRLRDEGRLAPVDAWMPGDLARRSAALTDGP